METRKVGVMLGDTFKIGHNLLRTVTTVERYNLRWFYRHLRSQGHRVDYARRHTVRYAVEMGVV